MSPRSGRPKSENPMKERLYIRCNAEDKEEIMDFSQNNGYSLLELIKIGMNKIKSERK